MNNHKVQKLSSTVKYVFDVLIKSLLEMSCRLRVAYTVFAEPRDDTTMLFKQQRRHSYRRIGTPSVCFGTDGDVIRPRS